MERIASFQQGLQRLYFPLSVHRRTKVNIKHPRPVHLPRRILEAVTQPVYPTQLRDPSKVCSILKYEKYNSVSQVSSADQKKSYEAFLVGEARKVFQKNQMVIAFQPESMDARKKTAVSNILHHKGLSLIFFPVNIMMTAIDGSKWHNMKILLHNPTALIVSEKPLVKDLLNVSKKIPELTLLGGVVEDLLLTREGLVHYSRLPPLSDLHCELLSTMQMPFIKNHQLLSSQQVTFVQNLEQQLKHLGTFTKHE
jgi:ribosomal protein L10